MKRLALPTVPVRCDCLTVCGDDPWLSDGRSRECQRRFTDRQEMETAVLRMRREAEARDSAVQLGHADVLEAMQELQRLRLQTK